jgi:hypothetical protein
VVERASIDASRTQRKYSKLGLYLERSERYIRSRFMLTDSVVRCVCVVI